MGDQPIQRRLAAIVATDMVGYSRLMEADEETTLTRHKAHNAELFYPKIAEHHGRIVRTTGDGLLIEFASAVDAVCCAVEMQRAVAEREADAPDDRRIVYRIGINVGDIIIDGGEIYGNGVNIAARLESLADPGGVFLSRPVYDQVKKLTDFDYEYLGEQQVKNIAEPVRSYRVVLDRVPVFEQPPSLPEKPSIAVLAFDNMSDDPDQEYFADGLAEDIITELSRYNWLLVIARNTTFTFKGASVDIKEVGRRLGVHYVLEGSVRKSGNRIRITAQLVDALTGDHIWAERYDRDLTDTFQLQDEITETVVASVPERLEAAELDRIRQKPPENMSAYEYLLRGKRHHHKSTPEDNAEALRLLDKAIALDPEYAAAYAWKACTLGQAVALGCGGDPQDLLAQDLENVQKGLSLDENDVECHRILCEFGMMHSKWEDAELHHEKAFNLNMNDPRIVAQRGELFTKLGRAEEGVTWVEKAMRLDPYGADSRVHLLARGFFAMGSYADAIDAYRRIPKPHYNHIAEMAACFTELGQDEDAELYAKRVLDLHPGFSVNKYLEQQTCKETKDQGALRDCLLKSGLPE